MKKIIMIGPDLAGQGGISRVVKTLAEGGLFEQYNVHYIVSASDGRALNKLFCVINGVIKTIIACCGKVSCVYIHTASNNSFYRKSIFIAIALLFGKRVFLHIHPSYFLIFISELRGFPRWYLHSLLKSVSEFVVLSEEVSAGLSKLFPGKKINVLRNPVNISALKNKSGFKREDKRLLFLGWYNKEKGVYDLVDAMKIVTQSIHDASLHFYGTKEVEKLRKYVQDNELSNFIRVNGWADQDKKLEELYRATMLILPSYTEGIPNVILEAMATRTPIIATQAGGMKEVLTDNVNALIIRPGDPEELSKKIQILLQDRALQLKLAECGYKDAETKYDVSIIIKRFGGIIGELTSSDKYGR